MKRKKISGIDPHGTFNDVNEALTHIQNCAYQWFQNYLNKEMCEKDVQEIYYTQKDCFAISRNSKVYNTYAGVGTDEVFRDKSGAYNCDLLFCYKDLLTPKGNKRHKVKPHWQRSRPCKPIIEIPELWS
jgi:hypothetical protein